MPLSVSPVGRFPLTRRTALAFWTRCIAMLSLLATSTIALGAAFQGIGEGLQYTLLGLGFVSALPVLWITLARVAEKRYLARPTKGLLATALGFDVGGIALVAGAVVLLQSEASEAAPFLAAGGLLEGCGTLLLLLWFVGARIVAPTGDHMHAL